MGPCCIVKGEGMLCLVSARDSPYRSAFDLIASRPHADKQSTRPPSHSTRLLAVRLTLCTCEGNWQAGLARNWNLPSGAKAPIPFMTAAARLKSCPFTLRRIPTSQSPASCGWALLQTADYSCRAHQTRQTFSGYIGCLLGQLKAFPNSSKFCTEPLVRHFPGECGSTRARRRASCSV